jgi:hypothetical protein
MRLLGWTGHRMDERRPEAKQHTSFVLRSRVDRRLNKVGVLIFLLDWCRVGPRHYRTNWSKKQPPAVLISCNAGVQTSRFLKLLGHMIYLLVFICVRESRPALGVLL